MLYKSVIHPVSEKNYIFAKDKYFKKGRMGFKFLLFSKVARIDVVFYYEDVFNHYRLEIAYG